MVIFKSENQSSLSEKEKNSNLIVYDNSNIQKGCSGVTTPLTFDFTRRVYASVYRQTIKTLSISERTILRNEDVFQNLVGLIKGRIYYNINSWYKGLQLFQSFHDTQSGLVHMLGLSDPLNFTDDEEKTWKHKFLTLWVKCVDFPRLLITFLSLKNRVGKFSAKMQHYCSEFYAQDLCKLELSGLRQLKTQLDENLLSIWSTPVINDLYIWVSYGDLVNKLKRAGFENPEEYVTTLLDEGQGFASMQPAKNLHQLAVAAAFQPDLKHLVNRNPADIHQQVKVRFPDFYLKVVAFIDEFGDKTTGELKLETHTMRSNPALFYNYLKDCLTAQISEIRASSLSKDYSSKAIQQQLSHLPASQRERIVAKVESLNKAVANREMFKLERSRAFGIYRTLYREFGRRFTDASWITQPEDIFFLTEDEIQLAGAGNEKAFDTLIATRRQEYKAYELESIPSRVFVSYTLVNPAVKEDAEHPVAIIQGMDSRKAAVEVA